MLKLVPILVIMWSEFIMFSFLQKKSEPEATRINRLFDGLKQIYSEEISEERKNLLRTKIEKFGYLPYPFIKALEELTPAEVLFGLEIKFEQNKVFENGKFIFDDEVISPVVRAGIKNSEWIYREQHNIKLINLAGLADGNKSTNPAKLINWLTQLLILPAGRPEDGVLSTTMYLIPFHPREFGCAYLPTSSEVSPNLEDKTIKDKLDLDAKAQVQLFIKLAQLAGHPVIYDVLPQTGRFSKIVLSNPMIARWYDINELITGIKVAVDDVFGKLSEEFGAEDAKIVADIYKSALTDSSCDFSEHYKVIYEKLDELLVDKKKELSERMLTKEEQDKIHKKVKKIIADILGVCVSKRLEEKDITKQGEIIHALIDAGMWPAPGGAWCSSGVPIFDKMAEHCEYPIFRHYDFKCTDVTHFANLDCQTPYYFVYLESGKYNKEGINAYISYLKNLQSDYNFDGFRVDHIDHIVDSVSEKDGIPISYRAPRSVLGKANETLKKDVPHFATMAEYMLWDRFYKEYHEDMHFDILWGDDIIAQCSKTPETIMNNNHELAEYNMKNPEISNLSILKTYNNQDGEFRDINQYPGQLGREGALFKWFKYKFLPGGKNAQRSVMYIDGDESFTKTGIESVIGAEVSMRRANDYDFFDKFDAINRFALNSELTRDGEAEIFVQDDDGFCAWIISKDPLKEALLVLANYNSPTEKMRNDNGCYVKEGHPVFNKSINLPCDYQIVSEFIYDEKIKDFSEISFTEPETEMTFDRLEPAQFKIFKLLR